MSVSLPGYSTTSAPPVSITTGGGNLPASSQCAEARPMYMACKGRPTELPRYITPPASAHPLPPVQVPATAAPNSDSLSKNSELPPVSCHLMPTGPVPGV